MNSSKRSRRLLLVGASTGGPGIVERIVAALPHNFPGGVVIAQHMDPVALASFAKRLQRVAAVPVALVDGPTPVRPGSVFVLAKTGAFGPEETPTLHTEPEERGFYRPTIDTLFLSAAGLEGVGIAALLLSGIGADGAKGLLALKEAGHLTIAQHERDCAVYGMPKRAVELGAATRVMKNEEILRMLKEWP